MEDLHSCVIRDETSQCKTPTGLGENFEDLLKQHREYDKVSEEMELEVKYERAKEEVEVINPIKGQTSREEFANRENEAEVVLQPIKNVNRLTGLGDNFEDLLKQQLEYDKVAEEMELEVKYERAKEEVEVINSIKGQTSREEIANRENEEEVVLKPIKNVNRIARARAVELLGLPPEDDDDDDSRNWWEPREKPFKVARGPPSTALKRFQDRFKKWFGLK